MGRKQQKWWEGNLAVTLLQVTQYAGGLLICFVYTQQWSYGCIDKTSLIIASCTEKSVQEWVTSHQASLKKGQYGHLKCQKRFRTMNIIALSWECFIQQHTYYMGIAPHNLFRLWSSITRRFGRFCAFVCIKGNSRN